MTHTQMAPAYVAASKKKCPLTVPLAVLGEVDTPVFDALTTALAVQWPDESDVDPYDFDEITVEGGEIYFADEDRLEPAPSWSTGKWGMAVDAVRHRRWRSRRSEFCTSSVSLAGGQHDQD